ncbi:MAG: FAD-dependent oxidoreductase, partial [Leptolyngbya sp.]|nr:FAD-dependent oxidoreductase [Candidatus Melainabacteria bacterium]
MHDRTHVAIIGAGLSGLACAYYFKKANIDFTIIESSDAVGGRVRSDKVDGYILDRGFQVLLTAYPEARNILDYDKLKLKSFIPGSLIRFHGNFHTIADPWRRPGDSLKTVFNPIGSFKDKMLIDKVRRSVTEGGLSELYARPEKTTLKLLEEYGFSADMIDRFFRPFFGGVFFDKNLTTSSKMFEFTFRMFSTGDTSLPANGMSEIPMQMLDLIGSDHVRLNTSVDKVRDNEVVLASGEVIKANAVVVATEGPEAGRLLGRAMSTQMRSTRCLYYSADKSPLDSPILVLNGDGVGVINNMCVPSMVSPSYAPPGKSLVSITVIGRDELPDDGLQNLVTAQLKEWFGKDVDNWKHLKTYNIKYGLPDATSPL